uniref:Reverse transcriptase domain-containing protein n=1 Tax=Micrurus lemniscatus lemniscatus TaxID=129467 RepID=A0A2D4H7V8_MICLE
MSWQFMIQQLKNMDFGENFIKMIQAIYCNQTVKVIINGETTGNFNIDKGTRQGCPLSTLLFILMLEVLLRQVRQDQEIKGLKIKNNIKSKRMLMIWYVFWRNH